MQKENTKCNGEQMITAFAYFGGCWPNFSLSFNGPPGVPGVDAEAGVIGAGGDIAMWFGMCNLGNGGAPGCGVEGVAPAAILDCLNVILGPGGGMPCSSRLRFAAAAPSLEGVSEVRIRSDL